MSSTDALVLIYACTAAFLAISHTITMLFASDLSRNNFMLFQWALLAVSIIAFLVSRGVASL